MVGGSSKVRPQAPWGAGRWMKWGKLSPRVDGGVRSLRWFGGQSGRRGSVDGGRHLGQGEAGAAGAIGSASLRGMDRASASSRVGQRSSHGGGGKPVRSG